jgi:hypothetical protein
MMKPKKNGRSRDAMRAQRQLEADRRKAGLPAKNPPKPPNPKSPKLSAEQREKMRLRAIAQWKDPASKLRNRHSQGHGETRRKPPKYAVQIIERAIGEYGATKEALADALNVSVWLFDQWLLRHEEIRNVFQKAKALEESKLVGMLFNQAMNKDNPSAAMFLLKARHNYRDSGTIPGQSDDPATKAAEIRAALKAIQKVDGDLGGNEDAPLPSIDPGPNR